MPISVFQTGFQILRGPGLLAYMLILGCLILEPRQGHGNRIDGVVMEERSAIVGESCELMEERITCIPVFHTPFEEICVGFDDTAINHQAVCLHDWRQGVDDPELLTLVAPDWLNTAGSASTHEIWL